MTRLDVADLVVIASRTLDLRTRTVLALLNVTAAQTALAEARAAGDPDDLAAHAAGLLHALTTHRPFPRGNTRIALAATLQLVALNGGRLDLDPPGEAHTVLTKLREGALDRSELTRWLTPRLRTGDPDATTRSRKETRMPRWLPRKGKPMFERFTQRARRVATLAQSQARDLRHNYVGTEHILLGLIQERGGVAAKALQSLGISLEAVKAEVEEIIGRGTSAPAGHIPFAPRAKKVLELSLREALQLGHNYIGTEHILLGLLREGQGVAAEVLVKLGADLSNVRARVLQLLSGEAAEDLPVPRVLAELDERIAEIRQQKDAAIDAEDFERAADLRRAERVILEDRTRREKELLAASDPEQLVAENQRLQDEVRRLHDLLRQHGIDPDNGATGTSKTA